MMQTTAAGQMIGRGTSLKMENPSLHCRIACLTGHSRFQQRPFNDYNWQIAQCQQLIMLDFFATDEIMGMHQKHHIRNT